MTLRGSYNRNGRYITLRREVGEWIQSLSGDTVTRFMAEAIEEYRANQLPPAEGLPLKSDRLLASYGLDNDVYQTICWWARRHEVVQTHVIRALLSEAYACREER